MLTWRQSHFCLGAAHVPPFSAMFVSTACLEGGIAQNKEGSEDQMLRLDSRDSDLVGFRRVGSIAKF